MKITSNSGIYKAIYHNGRYLLLFGLRKWQRIEILYEQNLVL